MKRFFFALVAGCALLSPALAESDCEANGIQTCVANLLYSAVWQPDFFITNPTQVKVDVGHTQANVLKCLEAIENVSEKTAQEIASRIPSDPQMPQTNRGGQLMSADSLRRFAAIARLAISDPLALSSNADYQTQIQFVQPLRMMVQSPDPRMRYIAAQTVSQMQKFEKTYLSGISQSLCHP